MISLGKTTDFPVCLINAGTRSCVRTVWSARADPEGLTWRISRMWCLVGGRFANLDYTRERPISIGQVATVQARIVCIHSWLKEGDIWTTAIVAHPNLKGVPDR